MPEVLALIVTMIEAFATYKCATYFLNDPKENLVMKFTKIFLFFVPQ